MDCGVLLFLGLVGGLVALLAMRSRQKQEEAAERVADQMHLYHDAYSKALTSEDAEKIVKAASALVDAARYWQPSGVAPVSEKVYRDVLRLLKAHPNIKPFVLSVGRAAYASRRPDGKATVYDEQAIMNDISAHSS